MTSSARVRRAERRQRYFAKLLEARLLGAVTPGQYEQLKKDWPCGFSELVQLINLKRNGS